MSHLSFWYRFVFSLSGFALSSTLFWSCKSRDYSDATVSMTSIEFHGLDAYGPIPSYLEDRFINCPVENKSANGQFNGKLYRYKTSDEVNYQTSGWQDRVAADWNALSTVIPPNMSATVIDIRRVGGKPAYLYLGNGTQNKLHEPWSSAKFMVASAAVAKARSSSNGAVGADSKVGEFDVGDMITAIHSYSKKGNVDGGGPQGFEGSNGVADYFLRTATPPFVDSFIKGDWLRIKDGSQLTSGFGEPKLFNPDGVNVQDKTTWRTSSGKSLTLNLDRSDTGHKEMSPLTQAEWMKRLAMHEVDPSTKMPYLTAKDVEIMFYGSALNRNNNPESQIGGMLAGESVYVAQALFGKEIGQAAKHGGNGNAAAKAHLDKKTGGKWRIFHKLGAGDSGSRLTSEIVHVSYTCLPKFDGGREFIIVLKAGSSEIKPDETKLGEVDLMQTKAFDALIPLLVPGFRP